MAGCGDTSTVSGGQPPAITALTTSAPELEAGEGAALRCQASDPEGAALRYAWSAEGGSLSGRGAEVTWTAPTAPGPYEVRVTVTDDAGLEATASVSMRAWPRPAGAFLVATHSGLASVTAGGEVTMLNGDLVSQVEVQGGRVFTRTSVGGRLIRELDAAGDEVRRITIANPLPPNGVWMAAVPGDRFVLMSNRDEYLSVIDAQGDSLAGAEFLNRSPGTSFQSLDAMFAGDDLVICCSSEQELMLLDLESYAVSLYRNLAVLGGAFTIAADETGQFSGKGNAVYAFERVGDPRELARLETSNTTGMVAVNGHVYTVTNFGGILYRINPSNGAVKIVAEGFNRPEDVGYLP